MMSLYKINIYTLLVLFVAGFMVLQSCNEQEITPSTVSYLIQSNGERIELKTNSDIASYLSTRNAFKDQVVENAILFEAEDSEGKFYIAQGQFTSQEGYITTVSIPLNMKITKKSNNNLILLSGEGSCEMTCEAEAGCSGCEQTIHERCKRQSCVCKQSNGKCKGSVKFSSES